MNDLHVAQTQALIDSGPEAIVFIRKTRSSDGAGGKRVSSTKHLQPQTVRVVGLRAPLVRTTSDGREVTVTKAVIGLPTLDVEVGDTFVRDSHPFEVVTKSNDPVWRIVAEVTQRGN